ncbi:hypothetical protein KM92DES2_11706 [uncultured Desulfovibrio sp.]|uniref:Uncharacterized protein n=1 Tax=uncultured Desulfovibrio sp. TaxID=167968 RepID=A0A212JTK0_9BACT|nr:hypothetical protein KM92DES2_11706 [uncultured Desulfovibrio sp.]
MPQGIDACRVSAHQPGFESFNDEFCHGAWREPPGFANSGYSFIRVNFYQYMAVAFSVKTFFRF